MSTPAKSVSARVLSERAVLVHIGMSRPGFLKADKDAQKTVAEEYGANEERVVAKKYTIDPKILADLKKAEGKVRAYYTDHTVPWFDGVRLASAKGIDKFTAKIKELRSEWEVEMSRVVAALPAAINEGKTSLGGLGKDDDYLDIDELMKKFKFTYDIMPVPDKRDIRTELSDEIMAETQASCDRIAAEAAQNVVEISKGKIKKVLSTLSETLTAKNTGTQKGGEWKIFRDSLVTNTLELAELLKELNVIEDPEIDKVADNIFSAFAKVDPDQIRDNDEVRKEVAGKAEAVMEESIAALSAIGYGS